MQHRVIGHSEQQTLVRMMHWTLVLIMLLQQMKATDAAKFKGDSCVSKNQPGICKEWGECPIIKTLIESGEYTNREVVSCGFGIREELICCPVVRTGPNTETKTSENTDRFSEQTTATPPVRDFWLDLLQNTTNSTTAAPDFWLDLLNPTTTTTTTLKPLIIGEQRLNESSEFFDFNALLSGSQQERQTSPGDMRPSNQDLLASSGNGHGPVNINQSNLGQTGNSFNRAPSGFANTNNARGHEDHNNFVGINNGNIGWGQSNSNRGLNVGRGPPINNNGRGHINGRGPHNNGKSRNGMGLGNQNQGFVFPQNNMRPNNFFGEGDNAIHRPGGPINNMEDQNPNLAIENNPDSNINKDISNKGEQSIDDLIKNVFETSTTANANSGPLAANNNQEKPNGMTLEDSIANVFNVHKSGTASPNPAQEANSPQPVVWLPSQRSPKFQAVDYVELNSPHQQMELTSPPALGHFEIIPAVDNQINGNSLFEAPSTSFIQQPALVETWSVNPVHKPDFNPVQIVYENLVNSGMSIVKAQEIQPAHIVLVQPQQPTQQFGQQPKFIYEQPQAPQNFGPEFSQQMIHQPLQRESSSKETRSASPPQHGFVPETNSGLLPNVQSPPLQILDPFKPFEFRPSPEDENTFLDGNNSLSTNLPSVGPDTRGSTDRPAVRACRRIEKGLSASLSPHILGGVPAELGEFPHMAAIGYSRIGGDDRPPYDIRCGGTLIDKRFILTAAHCVSERENIPSIVRLGVVNFTDVKQMAAAVELRIKQTYIHDDYLTRLTYNDIAVLELERDVEYSEYIYPVCLYTNESDPDANIKLWVTGWGTVNTTTRSFSDILLKAPLHTSPLQNCNKSFTDYGLNRRIPEGIIRTQLCAEDKEQIKDACQGDSGGPLNMIVDESYKNYRLVGVVSSGFGCASSTPGLYTKVAAFLDFIEKVVWPNGGD